MLAGRGYETNGLSIDFQLSGVVADLLQMLWNMNWVVFWALLYISFDPGFRSRLICQSLKVDFNVTSFWLDRQGGSILIEALKLKDNFLTDRERAILVYFYSNSFAFCTNWWQFFQLWFYENILVSHIYCDLYGCFESHCTRYCM